MPSKKINYGCYLSVKQSKHLITPIVDFISFYSFCEEKMNRLLSGYFHECSYIIRLEEMVLPGVLLIINWLNRRKSMGKFSG